MMKRGKAQWSRKLVTGSKKNVSGAEVFLWKDLNAGEGVWFSSLRHFKGYFLSRTMICKFETFRTLLTTPVPISVVSYKVASDRVL